MSRPIRYIAACHAANSVSNAPSGTHYNDRGIQPHVLKMQRRFGHIVALSALLMITLAPTSLYAAAIFWSYGADTIIKVAPFPDNPIIQNNTKHYDAGYIYKTFNVFFVPIWVYDEHWCGYINDKAFYPMTRDELERPARIAGIDLPYGSQVPFWDAWGGKLLIISILVSYALWKRSSIMDAKSQRDASLAQPTAQHNESPSVPLQVANKGEPNGQQLLSDDDWKIMVRYNDTFAQCNQILAPLGPAAVTEFRKTYLYVNDETKAIKVAQDVALTFETKQRQGMALENDLFVSAKTANETIIDGKRIILTVAGIPRVVIVPLSDLELLDKIDQVAT